MIINRIIYIITLAASMVLYALYPPWISWYMLVLLLLLIPLDFLVSLPGMLSKRLYMTVPLFCEKDEKTVLTLKTIHIKSYPVSALIAKLHVTGDDFFTTCRLKCPAEVSMQRELPVDTSQTGVTVFELKRIKIVSLLGLFTLSRRPGTKLSILVLPAPVKPTNTVALQQGTSLRPKPGGGFSEEHDLREYRHGDPVKSIHWKVSAKYDSLVIREPLELPPHSRLVHIMPWKTAAERDFILGSLRWVSTYMLKWKMPFYVRFGDEIAITEVTDEAALIHYLREVLDKTAGRAEKPAGQVPTRFSWIYRVEAGSGSL